jgi:hypothetical protein
VLPFETVRARQRQARQIEVAFKVCHRPTADDCDPLIEGRLEMAKKAAKVVADLDPVGRHREVHQCSVKVEE